MSKRAPIGAFLLLSALAAILSCKKPAPGPADAAAEAGAVTGIDASATIIVRTDAPSDAGPRIVSLSEAMPGSAPEPPSWNGYYKCGKSRLKITHYESTVTGRASSDTEEKTYTCHITGDTCVGTETDLSQGGKAKGPTSKSRKLTMRRDSMGAIHYSAEGTSQQTCPKL